MSGEVMRMRDWESELVWHARNASEQIVPQKPKPGKNVQPHQHIPAMQKRQLAWIHECCRVRDEFLKIELLGTIPLFYISRSENHSCQISPEFATVDGLYQWCRWREAEQVEIAKDLLDELTRQACRVMFGRPSQLSHDELVRYAYYQA